MGIIPGRKSKVNPAKAPYSVLSYPALTLSRMEHQNIRNQSGIKPLKQKSDFKDMILFEDDDFILVNKPPFISTLEDRHGRPNLLALARKYVATAQVCHRLDKDTSGVLAIAKNPDA